MSETLPPENPDGPRSTPDESQLLFDPNAAPPGFGDPSSSTDRAGKPLLGLGLAALAVIALGTVGFFMLRANAPAEAEGPAPVQPVATGRGPIIEPVPDSTQSREVGTVVELAFRVATRVGDPEPGFPLTFAVSSGEGVLESTSAVTDSLGVARTSVVLPARPGTTIVTASAESGNANPARATLIASVGLPASIRIAAGDRQQAPMGELLPERVAVIVSDASGNPVYNAEVRFRVDMGEGLAAPSLTRTDSLGRASAVWRLGMMEGRHELTALSSGVTPAATFIATGAALGSAPEEDLPEATAVRVVPVDFAVGGSHVCVIRSGIVSCRGNDARGQLAAGGRGNLVSLVAGASHACGLEGSGVAVCWGANERGQVGDGSRTDRNEPTRVRTELRFSELTAGAAHTCGLAGSGVPFCWGHNLNGQLGDGSRNDQTAPRTVGGGLQFRTIESGWNHTCGLTSNGNAFCWGLNSQGQLGDGGTLDRLVPTLVLGAVETLVAGSAHTCGVADGAILCWGQNDFGQLGDGTNENRTQPTRVAGLPGRPTELAAGAVHTCALIGSGDAYCWGQNLQGQLGDGSTENRASPTLVSGGLRFREIHAGGALTCGITTDGSEYCWGLNQTGQLGDGTRVSRSTPTQVAR